MSKLYICGHDSQQQRNIRVFRSNSEGLGRLFSAMDMYFSSCFVSYFYLQPMTEVFG